MAACRSWITSPVAKSCVYGKAVVKSTFVESKTSPRPGLSSPSQDRVQRGSSPSPRGSSPSQVQVQMRQSKQRNKKRIFFKATYLTIIYVIQETAYLLF